MKQFVFVSVHDYKAPSAVKKVGYFDGKRRAEKLIGELFGAKVSSLLLFVVAVRVFFQKPPLLEIKHVGAPTAAVAAAAS